MDTRAGEGAQPEGSRVRSGGSSCPGPPPHPAPLFQAPQLEASENKTCSGLFPGPEPLTREASGCRPRQGRPSRGLRLGFLWLLSLHRYVTSAEGTAPSLTETHPPQGVFTVVFDR